MLTAKQQAEKISEGRAFQLQRQFKQAELCFKSILREDPKHVDALHRMGLLAIESGHPSVGCKYLHAALDQKPNDPVILQNIGAGLIMQGKAREALPYLHQAMKFRGDSVEVITNIGIANRKLGITDEAIKYFTKALDLDRGFTRAHLGLAGVLVEAGRSADALLLYRDILQRDKFNVEALCGASKTQSFDVDDPELGWIESLLEENGLDIKSKTALHHAAGKICHDIKQYEDAFKHIQKSKETRHRLFPIEYHKSVYRHIVKNTSSDSTFWQTNSGNESDVPVFIVGMPRSGTTLVEQIIASHPDAHGAGELPNMRRTGGILGFGNKDMNLYSERLSALTAIEMNTLSMKYLESLTKGNPGAIRCTDKYPQNYEQLGLIAKLFPRARVIHCRRDPLDTCLSIYMLQFADGHAYNRDLETLGQYYVAYKQLMSHWLKVLPLQILEVDYEDLVADQDLHTRKIIDFLKLDWNDACLRFFENERTVKTPSKWQVRQPMYTSSMGKWRHYERHLGPLITALHPVLHQA